MTFYQKVRRSTLMVYASNGVNFLVNLWIPIVLIKFLSQADYGAFRLIQSLLIIGISTTSFGLQAVLARFGPELIATYRHRAFQRLFLSVSAIRICAVLVFLGLLTGLRESIFNFFHFPTVFFSAFFVIASLLFFLLTKTLIGSSFLAVFMEQYKDNLNIILMNISKLILFSWLALKGAGIEEVMLSWAFVEGAGWLLYLGLAMLKLNRLRAPHPKINPAALTRFEWQRFVLFGLFNYASSNISVFHNLMLDNFVISRYMNVIHVALYGLVSTLISLILMLSPIVMAKSIFHTGLITKYAETKDPTYLYRAADFMHKLVLFIGVPAIVGMYVLGERIIVQIFNPDYVLALGPLRWLLIFTIFTLLTGPLGILISAVEKPHVLLFAGLSSMYNLVMDVVLVTILGLSGIAIATGTAGVLQWALFFIFLKRYLPEMRLPWGAYLRIFLNVLPMLLFLVLVEPYLNSVPAIIVGMVFAAAVYAVMCIRFKVFSAEERAFVQEVSAAKWWVF